MPGAPKRGFYISSPHHIHLPIMDALKDCIVPYLTRHAQCSLPALLRKTCGTNSVQRPHISPTSKAPPPTLVRPLTNFGTVENPLFLISAKSDAGRLHSSLLTTQRFIIVQLCANSLATHPTPRRIAFGIQQPTVFLIPFMSPLSNIVIPLLSPL